MWSWSDLRSLWLALRWLSARWWSRAAVVVVGLAVVVVGAAVVVVGLAVVVVGAAVVVTGVPTGVHAATRLTEHRDGRAG